MTRVTPSFEIDIKGRTICQAHSDYLKFINPTKDYFEDLQMESQLTCLTCDHYSNDDCIFSKEELDLIERKRKRHIFNAYRCMMCGNKIHIMLTIVNKLLQEKIMPNIVLPLICCNCHEALQNKEVKKLLLKRIFSSIEILLFALFFIFLTIFSYSITKSFPFIIIPLILASLSSALTIIRLRLIYFALRGWKYYSKFLK